jgi:hypothetical protein
MPSNQAVAREAQLVKAVARWLREQGVPCTVLGWPDRERDPCSAGLTVEAVLAVGADAAKMDWAVDVMTVPVPPGVSAGMAEARQHIQPDAAALAGAAHRAITIGIRIPAGSPADRKAYYKHVLELVEEALQTGDEYYDASDPETQVLLSDDEFIGDPSGPLGAVRVHLVPFVGVGADLLAELRVTLAEPLTKKLGNQLKRAKDLGYPTLLVLDQHGHPGLPAGTAWLASDGAVRTVVAEYSVIHPGVLDAAVLACPGDSIVQIFGSGLPGPRGPS